MLSYWVNVFITSAQSQKKDQDHVVMITTLPQHAYHVCVIRHLLGFLFLVTTTQQARTSSIFGLIMIRFPRNGDVSFCQLGKSEYRNVSKCKPHW